MLGTELLNHPVVRDFQFMLLMGDGQSVDTSNLTAIVLSLMWEMQFWSIVLLPFLAVYLPILGIQFADSTTGLGIDADVMGATFGTFNYEADITWYRWFKLLADATTVYIWYFSLPNTSDSSSLSTYTDSLVYDGNIGTLFWIQWVFLPVNAVFFGSWTLILFPVTAVVLIMNWFVWADDIKKFMNYAAAANMGLNIILILLAAMGMI